VRPKPIQLLKKCETLTSSNTNVTIQSKKNKELRLSQYPYTLPFSPQTVYGDTTEIQEESLSAIFFSFNSAKNSSNFAWQ
jgi:hypothetical protein